MVTAYENGSRRVAITTLLLLVRTFGTSIEAFVGSLALRFPGQHVSQLLPAPASAWPAKCWLPARTVVLDEVMQRSNHRIR